MAAPAASAEPAATTLLATLQTALRMQASRFKAADDERYVAAALTLARDGVCARCLLRVAGHTGFDGYAQPAPSRDELLAALSASSPASGPTPAPAPQPPEGNAAGSEPGAEGASSPAGAAAGPEASAPQGAAAAGQRVPGSSEQEQHAASRVPPCPLCFGLLETLMEAGGGGGSTHQGAPQLWSAPQEAAQGPASEDTAATTAAAGTSQQQQRPAANGSTLHGGAAAEAAAAAAGGGAGTGAEAPDLTWLRIRYRAVTGVPGTRIAAATVGHQRLLGRPSAAALAAAVRSQAAHGPPDPAAAALEAAAAGARRSCGNGGDSATAPLGEAESFAVAAAGGAWGDDDAAVEAAEEAAAVGAVELGPRLPFGSFALEVPVVPSAAAIRDHAVHAWLTAKYGSTGGGAMYGGWRAGDIVPLASVLRRALSAVLSRQLGLPSVAPQSADMVVSVVATDGPAGLAELRTLAEDQAAHIARRHQQQRSNKRQKGARQQQQPQQQQQQAVVEGGGAAPSADAAGAGAAGGAAPPQVPTVPEERVRDMTWEGVNRMLSAMPRQVLARLCPWPPPQSHHQQQQEPAASAAAALPAASGQSGATAAQATGAQEAEAGGANGSHAAGSSGQLLPPQTTEGEALRMAPCVWVRAARPPILLAGRYLKLRRHTPQCPWFDLSTGARIGGRSSVQEAVEAAVLPLYGTVEAKMVTGGREDADVRMLGNGRPFVLEIQAPLRGHPSAEELRRAEERLGASACGVGLRGLAPADRAALDVIKAAEESKEKTYRALCWADAPLAAAHMAALVSRGRVVCAQSTPVRVLHRRAQKVRPKWLQVECAEVLPGRPHYFVLTLRTQAGAYVKEFCNGDFGRCEPSLGDLLGQIITAQDGSGGAGGGSAGSGQGEDGDAAMAEAGGAAGGAKASGAAAEPEASGRGPWLHTEILQLDVLDVHLDT